MASGDLYPHGPEHVPADLTAPTSSYRMHAWVAFSTLLLFVGLYASLTAWIGWVAWRLLADSWGGGEFFFGLLMAIPALFLFVFLVKGFFFRQHTDDSHRLEVTAADEPELIKFVNQIADDAGAPRPHRVFLSSRVNAAVFYDLTILNLVFPSKKNLEIGLGLVNAVTLDEFKAVMAHEFGHFAQKTMAVGRWVYIAQQIVSDVVSQRGALDNLLIGLSHFDLRVAWIGWIMRLVVWAIRAIVDTGFRAIMLAQHALSREMELQADLVSVSLAGSDSLIHGLHKLGPADDAWGRAAQYTHGQVQQGRAVEDFFELQSHIQERMGQVRDDPDYGSVPIRPDRGQAQHRVFADTMAQPPQMWSTHPPNRDREENAKRRYFPSILDERSPWLLFADAESCRREVTKQLIGLMSEELPATIVPVAESIALIDAQFEVPHLAPRYRGLYYSRSPYQYVSDPGALIQLVDGGMAETLSGLYQESVQDDLRALADSEDEVATLQALQDGFLEAPGGLVRYRGEDVPRKQLDGLLETVRQDKARLREVVVGHDSACRSVHWSIAGQLGGGWAEYLESLGRLAHYCHHVGADLADARDYLSHVIAVVTADGNVSSSEMRRLINTGEDLERAMDRIFIRRNEIVVPKPILDELEIEHWSEALPEQYTLGAPTAHNMASWLDVIDGWVGVFGGPLDAAGRETLLELLAAEDHVAKCFREGSDPGQAPKPAKVPKDYPKCVPGDERERDKQLVLWDRFILAEGWLPGTARFAAAAAILAGPLWYTMQVGDTKVLVFNGLNIPVQVDIAGSVSEVLPGRHHQKRVVADFVEVRTTTADGEVIETFEVDASNTWATYVYNVAQGSPLVEWTASYGYAAEVPPRMLSAPRWFASTANYNFSEPPNESEDGNKLEVLAALNEESPRVQVAQVDPEDVAPLVTAHLRWDDANDSEFFEWAEAAFALDLLGGIVDDRLDAEPENLGLLRLGIGLASMTETQGPLCERAQAMLERRSDDPDVLHLAHSCLPPDERRRASLAAHERFPDHAPLGIRAGYAHARDADWEAAEALLTKFWRSPNVYDCTIDLARIRRMLGRGRMPVDTTGNAELEFYDRVGSNEFLEANVRGYRFLAKGDLDKALELEDPGDPGRPLTRLVAASEGATPTQVQAAKLPYVEEGLGQAAFFASAAVAAREGWDVSAYVDALGNYLPREDLETVAQVFDIAAVEADPGIIDRAVVGSEPSLRGRVRLVGVILLGDQAPDLWRKEAKALLFEGERPYLR